MPGTEDDNLEREGDTMDEFFEEELRLEVQRLAWEQEMAPREIAKELEMNVAEVRAIIRRSMED